MWRSLMVLSLVIVGFVGGALITGTFITSGGDGLSGGPQVLLGGLAGAVVLPIVGLRMTGSSSASARRAAALSMALAAVAAGWVLMRLVM